MKYIDAVYGNRIGFTDKQSRKTRERLLREDKNRVVYAACIYRKRWGEIEGFKDFRYNVTEGSWIITMSATEAFHDRFRTLLNDPKVLGEFFKHQKRYLKRYHRMAKKFAVKRDDEGDVSEGADSASE